MALPVVREAAERTGGRFVYDIADLHVESGRLAAHARARSSPTCRGRERRLDGRCGRPDDRHRSSRRRDRPAVRVPPADRRHELPAALAARRARRLPHSACCATRSRAAATEAAADAPILLYQGAFREDQGIEELLTRSRSKPLRRRAA